jgi:hypothetical protein
VAIHVQLAVQPSAVGLLTRATTAHADRGASRMAGPSGDARILSQRGKVDGTMTGWGPG